MQSGSILNMDNQNMDHSPENPNKVGSGLQNTKNPHEFLTMKKRLLKKNIRRRTDELDEERENTKKRFLQFFFFGDLASEREGFNDSRRSTAPVLLRRAMTPNVKP
ncbi:hypothetical protein Scep_027842 [Stephania cephalantha]|uniref:Uncharacterized protein n=1 Tax=Stephania cephalantha TaxID=152367 RepID=A0AAP0EB09_9MAGN